VWFIDFKLWFKDVKGLPQQAGYEPSNLSAQWLHDKLNVAQQPLWFKCNNHAKLSVVLRLMSIKYDYKGSVW